MSLAHPLSAPSSPLAHPIHCQLGVHSFKSDTEATHRCMSTGRRSARNRTETPQKTKLVGGLFAVGGVLSVLSGLSLFVASSQLGDIGMAGLAGLGAILGTVFLAIAGASIAIAYGLWNVKSWGWYGAVGLLGFEAVTGIWALLSGVGVLSITLVVAVVALWALWDEQSAFGLDHELPI